MKLELALTLKYEDSELLDSVPILEGEDAGPRWAFRYNKFKNDPTPDALVLGMYRHPNTGNNLVGAINLRYLTTDQIEQLRRELPKLLNSNNLKSRYWLGKRLMPDIFDNYYRTYDASHIHNLQRGAIYPKYGVFKTAANFVKKAVTSPFKSKKQKEIEAMPQYPSDLRDLSDRLDAVTQKIVQEPDDATPQQLRNASADINRQDKIPSKRLQSIEKQGQQAQQQIKNRVTMPTQTTPTQTEPIQQTRQPTRSPSRHPEIGPNQQNDKLRKSFEKDAEDARNELNDIKNDRIDRSPRYQQPIKNKIDTDISDTEDISGTKLEYKYWCPTIRRYIVETIEIHT